MDFRPKEDAKERQPVVEGALQTMWDRMLERSYEPHEWFVENDPPVRAERAGQREPNPR